MEDSWLVQHIFYGSRAPWSRWEAADSVRVWATNTTQVRKTPKLAQRLGQLQPFTAVFPQECMGQLAIFQANLTPFSLAERRGVALHLPADGALRPAGGRLALLQPHGLRSLNLKFTGLTQNLGHL